MPQFAAAALGSLGSLAPGGAAGSLGTLSELPGVLRAKHPEVYGHLSAAGGELLAAYRAAVSGHERRWSAGAVPTVSTLTSTRLTDRPTRSESPGQAWLLRADGS